MDIRFIGHATVELTEGSTNVLIDPFLAPNNPVATVTAEEVEPTHILVTHGHADHTADLIEVAERTGAHVVSMVEISRWHGAKGHEDSSEINIGGTARFDWGWVKMVQAFHTNTLEGEDGIMVGPPAGLVVNIGGKTVYHLGDTGLFGDLKLIAESTPIDVALIPIGGKYTMDRHDGVTAAKLIGAETVIPIHYDTFQHVETDAEAYKADVESQTSSKVVLLKPGETFSP
jgi:L-ascorbate metabolism protein UlaG (beta-lactamase superfamily)